MGGVYLRFLSRQPDSSLHCETSGIVHRSTHFAYPRTDGQAELI